MLTPRSGASALSASLSGLAVVLALSQGNAAMAQGHTPDPYNIVGEYNNQYEPYMYASQPTNDGVFPNQSRMMERAGNRSANRFQNFSDSLDGAEPDNPPAGALRRSGAGTPYYRAYRRFDQDFDRLYRPNKEADSSFYVDQNQRSKKYFEAIRETDPRKRAQLLREYNLDNMKAARGLSTNRNAPERDRAPAPAPRSSLSDPLSGLTAPGGRRSSSPASRLPGGASALRPSTLPRTAAPPVGGRAPGAGATRTPSDSLERNDLLERATRATRGSAPRPTSSGATAPPPR